MKVTNESGEQAPTTTAIVTHSDRFGRFAARSSHYLGSRWAFIAAIGVIVVWALTGPIFHYSDTWQLVINTGTTIVTFLMVFLIQNTQNRDIMAVQLKLSELVLAMKGAKNKFAAIEDLSDDELAKLHDECRARAEMTLRHLDSRRGAGRHKPRAISATRSPATASADCTRAR